MTSIRLRVSILALGLVFALPAAAYDVTGFHPDPSTAQYQIACEPGDAAFDAFDLAVDASDLPSSYELLSGPSGWSIAPALVTRDGRFFVRISGPALSCPTAIDVVVRYTGPHFKTGYGAVDLVSNDNVVHPAACLPGWFPWIICEPWEPLTHCPAFIFVVGAVDGGAQPDPVGLATITVRDFANNPVPNAQVTLDFSGCCDIDLCSAVVNGQSVSCPGGLVQGVTNAAGQFSFTVLGAARDPGNITPCGPGCIHPGAGLGGVRVRVSVGAGQVQVCTMTAACLDQNGAAGIGGSNGTSISDVGNVLNLFGAVALGAPYKGRGDLNQDGNITISDVGRELYHFGRLALSGGVGCTASFCGTPACP